MNVLHITLETVLQVNVVVSTPLRMMHFEGDHPSWDLKSCTVLYPTVAYSYAVRVVFHLWCRVHFLFVFVPFLCPLTISVPRCLVLCFRFCAHR